MRPSFSAQALVTAELALSVPGVTAQPPFSISERWSQEAAFLNSISFAVESLCCWNFSTQIGASTLTIALSARSAAMRSAVLPSIQPICEKPTNDIAAAPATAPQSAGFTPGWIFIAFSSISGKDLFLICKPRFAALSGGFVCYPASDLGRRRTSLTLSAAQNYARQTYLLLTLYRV